MACGISIDSGRAAGTLPLEVLLPSPSVYKEALHLSKVTSNHLYFQHKRKLCFLFQSPELTPFSSKCFTSEFFNFYQIYSQREHISIISSNPKDHWAATVSLTQM
jgi:hypothetical protein